MPPSGFKLKRHKPFDAHAARLHHAEAQSRPHPLEGKRPYSVRTEPRGFLVARCFLALTEAKPRNRTRKEKAWMASSDRGEMLARLRQQIHKPSLTFELPLRGRPLVLCTRYSSTEPDVGSNWSKLAVDCLQPPGERTYTKTLQHPYGHTVKRKLVKRYDGLGVIASDSPKHTDVVEQWQKAKAGAGFAVIEVWTG